MELRPSFNIRAGILSGPVALLPLIASSSFSIPSVDTVMSGILCALDSGSCGTLSMASLVKTEENCLLSASALDVASECDTPFWKSVDIPHCFFLFDLINDHKFFEVLSSHGYGYSHKASSLLAFSYGMRCYSVGILPNLDLSWTS